MKTSYQLFRGIKPLIDFLCPFGCSCTLLNTQDQKTKFDAVSDECFFVGYSNTQKAYRVYKSPIMLIGKSQTLQVLVVNAHGFTIPPLFSNHLIFLTLTMMTSFLILQLQLLTINLNHHHNHNLLSLNYLQPHLTFLDHHHFQLIPFLH